MTNFERIKAMNDKELFEFLDNNLDSFVTCRYKNGCTGNYPCFTCKYSDNDIKKWLKSEVAADE